MPIYDYKCTACGNEVLDQLVPSHKAIDPMCSKCGGQLRRKVSLSVPNIFPSEGIHLRDVSPTGKTFYSKKEMLDWEKQTGGYIDRAH